tara:strand:+ start:334 stop:528 length:195 start_codon:yes stop_codon:yes gene_type:complete
MNPEKIQIPKLIDINVSKLFAMDKKENIPFAKYMDEHMDSDWLNSFNPENQGKYNKYLKDVNIK